MKTGSTRLRAFAFSLVSLTSKRLAWGSGTSAFPQFALTMERFVPHGASTPSEAWRAAPWGRAATRSDRQRHVLHQTSSSRTGRSRRVSACAGTSFNEARTGRRGPFRLGSNPSGFRRKVRARARKWGTTAAGANLWPLRAGDYRRAGAATDGGRRPPRRVRQLTAAAPRTFSRSWLRDPPAEARGQHKAGNTWRPLEDRRRLGLRR